VTGDPTAPNPAPDYSTLAEAQRKRVAELRAQRDAQNVNRTLAELDAAARDSHAPLMEPMLDAVRARATLGEISDVLREAWGVYDPR
jgi:methylmalonyl-CoA mutase N-terminal domain/subunit